MNSLSKYTEEYLREKKKHPQKIYYLKYANGKVYVTSCINSNISSYKEYYRIDNTHSALNQLLYNFENKYLNDCETAFQSYIKCSFENNPQETDKALINLTSSFKQLHPFFKDIKALIWYILEHIIIYFECHISYFVHTFLQNKNSDESNMALTQAILDYLRHLFNCLISPIISKDECCSTAKEFKYASDALWQRLLYLAKKYSFESDIVFINTYIKEYFSYPKSKIIKPAKKILQSLFTLKDIMTNYSFVFSDIIIHLPQITKTQAFCLFMSRNEFSIVAQEIDYHRIIPSPNSLYSILRKDVPYLNATKESRGPIFIGEEFELFDIFTENAYENSLSGTFYHTTPEKTFWPKKFKKK